MCKETPDYDKVIKYCDLVLEDQPNNAKAYFRKAVSQYHLRDFEKSLKNFLSAKEHMTSPGEWVTLFYCVKYSMISSSLMSRTTLNQNRPNIF